jgi:endo-1,4-beta-xylanase
MTVGSVRFRRPRLLGGRSGAAITALTCAAAFAVPLLITQPATADGTLRAHAAERGKFIGFAAATGPLANEAAYRNIAATEFNQVTAENAMKWESTQPNPGQFTFGGADQVVAFAQQNGQQVHGHTLVWHSQTPGWVQSLGATQMRSAMQTHINTVVGRWASNPAVVSWDVVNEAFNEDGSMRQSFWLNTLGQSYIADAFRFARAADPNARLCLNDFNVEGMNAKSNAMFTLVQSLLAQNVPIDCVGFQGHLAIQFGLPGQIQQNMQRFANLGLEVRITELDVRMQLPRSAQKDTQQAQFYTSVVNACNAVTACSGITIWGFTDLHSWVPGTFGGEGAALLWDENYNPKPAYTAVHTALDGGGGTVDTMPPSTPGTLTASGVTSSSVNLAWGASTDNVGVAGYDVLRATGASGGTFAQVGTAATTSFSNTGLTGSTTYRFQVRARDAAGNLSPVSNTVTVTTQPGGGTGGTCQVAFSLSPWGSGSSGFTAGVILTNTGTSAISSWTLSFALASGQTLSPPGWSATWTQSGQNVTAAPLSWNSTLPAGQSTSIGFNGTHTGNTAEPTAFTLGGSTCTVV